MATVLIVDDDVVTMQMLCEALVEEGMQAVGVSRPDEAEAVARDTDPDVIVVDLMLTGQRCGIELAADLRAAGSAAALIAMTASVYLAEDARDTDLFHAVLDKPFDVEDVLLAVSEAQPRHLSPAYGRVDRRH